jgi:hypothetical protein
MTIDILEFSGIAWPNPGMWTQAQSRSLQGSVSTAPRPFVSEVKEDEDAHAHSPRRPNHQDTCLPEDSNSKPHPDYEGYWANQNMPPPHHRIDTAAWNQFQPGHSNIVRQNGPLADPFLDPRALTTFTSRRDKKKSSEDTPMPDVPSCEGTRNVSGIASVSYEHKSVSSHTIATHEAIMNQLVEALSPLKSDDDGPHKATNTPSSGRVFSKPSAAAQARAASRQLACAGIYEKDDVAEAGPRNASTKVISANPGTSVHSKKEGEDNKENTPDHRVAGAEFTRPSSPSGKAVGTKSAERNIGSTDSKRKRPLEEISLSVHTNAVDESISPSPSKKVSKMASGEILLKSGSPRTPDGRRDVSGGATLKVAARRD